MKRPKQFTPGAEKLRSVIRELYSPIDWKFDEPPQVMHVTPNTFHTASTLARELGVSVMTITRLVHRGVILPGRTPSGTMLFSATDIETLRIHLTK